MFDSLPIDEVETLMVELAHGSTSEKTGAIVSEHLATGGKRLRARLVLAASREFGVPFELAIPWAAACELLHNATLVHDDVQDGDETRRGQPTTWVRHGTASAINAGDLLLVLPTLAIERVNSDLSVRWHLARQLAYQATRVIRGQVAEYEMTHHGPIDLNTYYNAIDGKTSPLFELPVIGAALLAGRAPETAESLGAPFRSLGRLFQMQDDVLDLYGEKGRDQPGADIREGKISAIVVTHLTQYPEEKTDVLEILRLERDKTPTSEVERLIEHFRAAGTLQRVLQLMRSEAEAAETQLSALEAGRLVGLLSELTTLVLKPISHLLAD